MLAGNIHGLTSGTDTMMMKNSQWGAVAYLTQSDYGNKQTSVANSGVWNNSYFEGNSVEDSGLTEKTIYSTTLTGSVSTSRDDATSFDLVQASKTASANTIIITGNDITYPSGVRTVGSLQTKTFYRYHTTEGWRGSTTGNIYGVYDMAGGAMECVSGVLKNGTSTEVTTFMSNVPAKYRTSYAGTGATGAEEDRLENTNANSNMYGDAMWETSIVEIGYFRSWNNDSARFPSLSAPFFLRGARYYTGSMGGVFLYSDNLGSGGQDYGFRPVVF